MSLTQPTARFWSSPLKGEPFGGMDDAFKQDSKPGEIEVMLV
jgi:hypothetical protein